MKPETPYEKKWQGWSSFLDKETKKLEPTLEITTPIEDEKKRHLDDPHSPSQPQPLCKEEWQGWESFLSKKTVLGEDSEG